MIKTTLFCALALVSSMSSTTLAADAAPGVKLDASSNLHSTLKLAQAAGKAVELHTRGGKTFKGVITEVSEQHAVIGKQSGKDFFGVKIRLEAVEAIEVPNR